MEQPLPNNTLDRAQQIDLICDEFEQAWKQGRRPGIDEFLHRLPADWQPQLALELWAIECHYDPENGGHETDNARLKQRYPAVAALLDNSPTVELGTRAEVAAPTLRMETRSESAELHIRCPHCSNPVELLADVQVDQVSCASCGSQFSLVDDSDGSGKGQSLKTLGRFEMLARIGVGGFGTVWKARDTELDRIVALKIPRKGNLSTMEVEHFLREARAAAQLRHPNIVPVFEVGREENTVFIVSEFVQGVSLSDWMKEARRPATEIARICTSVTEALSEAHAAGIVHRDLKPSNIMLDIHGKPRLMDFGLAKREMGEVTMTFDGFVVGTPAYMSPEQARGEGHWTDQRTDIYSLGVMLFHLLTNELPFRGSPARQIQARLTSDPPHPRSLDPSVPRDLATVCLKCMEIDPNRRYQTAEQVGDELRRYLAAKPVLARPLPATARAWRWMKRHPTLSAALALASLLAIGGPTAALIIDGQRREIARRLDERTQLVNQREQERIELQNDLADLRAQLQSITGSPSGTQKLEPWRKDLIRSLLDKRYQQFATAASEQADPRQAGDVHRALGDLLSSVDETTRAIAEYQAAWDGYSELPLEDSARDRLLVALPLAGLLENEGRTDEARQVLDQIEQLVATHSRIAQLDYLQLRYAVEPDDRTKNKLFLEAGQVNAQLKENWPTEVTQVVSLRNLLLPRQ